MRKLIRCILDPKDKTIVTLLAKTDIEHDKLLRLEVEDMSLENSITLFLSPFSSM
jgi:hypothetical protein